MSFSSAELKRVDVVPVIVNLTRSLGLSSTVEGTVFTVLSELFNNALDHGLLALDSKIKTAPMGFERYLALRAERLADLSRGDILVRVDHSRGGTGNVRVRIRVRDSGMGFDHRAYIRTLSGESARNSLAPSGRGIALLLALCEQVSFNEQGNDVTVEFVES